MPVKKSGGGNWIGDLKKGGLHKSLGLPEGQTIPANKLKAAARGDYGPKAQKQAQAANTLRGLRPKGERG